MAKILPGIAVSKMSGTIAGTTYSNWRGILVARSKPTPTNVNTPRQSFVRSLLSTLSKAWRDELGPGLRQAWNQRASSYPWLDVFGNSVAMTGENLYIKQNFALLDHSLARQDEPVPDTNPPEIISAGIVETTDQLEIDLPGLDPAVVSAQAPFLDVSVAGGFLSVGGSFSAPFDVQISSLCLPQGRTHQKSDFRHIAYVNDAPIAEPPLSSKITIIPPSGTTRNIVVSIRRFNKYGNFSAPLLLNSVVERL